MGGCSKRIKEHVGYDEMTIDMLYDILKDVESAEENGLDSTELDYYESVLS